MNRPAGRKTVPGGFVSRLPWAVDLDIHMSKNSYSSLMVVGARSLRPLFWVRSSKRDYGGFPASVQDGFGFALFLAQTGQHPPSAKPLRGLGSGVVELIEDFDGDTYRAVYTVRFAEAVYVLHAFKKKSKRGNETPKADIALIERRLKDAAADHEARMKQESKR
jgi:phage-related protein